MRFNKFISIVFIILIICSCEERDGSFITPEDPQLAIEELNNIIENTNFSISLPSGEVVEFVPSEYFSFHGSSAFASESKGFHFTNEFGGFTISLPTSSGSGELQLLGNNYNFASVFCLPIDEFRDKYGFALESSFDNWVVYFAVNGNYSEEEIINDGAAIGVDNFLYYYVDPILLESYGGFFEKDSDVVFLNDSYLELKSEMAIECEGYVYTYAFEPFREVLVGDYSLKLRCN